MRGHPRGLLLGLLVAAPACADLSFYPEQVPTSLAIVPADTMLKTGDRVRYSVVVLDADGEAIGAPPSWARPVWTSADSSAVRIAPDGTVMARNFAETRITATFAGLRASTSVRVSPDRVALDAPVWYLMQTVQNQRGDVPLLLGRDALLRVFVVADQPSYYRPRVEVLFYENNVLTRSELIHPQFRQLPTEVDESTLEGSYNVLVPGDLVSPATEFVIEVDPQGLVPRTSASRLRIPEEGRLRMDLRDMPPLDLVLVPVRQGTSHDAEVEAWLDGIEQDSARLAATRTMLPLDELSVAVHEGFVTTVDLTRAVGWTQLLGEIVYLRIADGSRGHYYGVVNPGPEATLEGVAQIGEPHAVGRPNTATLTHELGHTFGLRHAPCGVSGSVDRAYPYANGAIGAWGFDFARGGLVNASLYKDVMSYCDPHWISDYHYGKAMAHLLDLAADRRAGGARAGDGIGEGRAVGRDIVAAGASDWSSLPPTAPGSGSNNTLLVWGRAGLGELSLDPSFVVNAPPALPSRAGPYRVDGVGRGGTRLFSLDFDVRPVDHAAGAFVFTVPYDPDADGPLERLVLTGPEGEHVLERRSAPPMALVTDAATGRLRAIVRDWNGTLPATVRAGVRRGPDQGAIRGRPAPGSLGGQAAGAVGGSLRIAVSEGVPEPAAGDDGAGSGELRR